MGIESTLMIQSSLAKRSLWISLITSFASIITENLLPFTVGRKNRVLLDTIKGAEASAVIYSLVETAKANNLRTYEYLELLLTEIPYHMDDKNFDYLENLMPWSDYVQERCHFLKNNK